MSDLFAKLLSAPTSGLKRTISSILMVLSAFFATWGAGLQQVSSLDLSKIFPGLAVLLIFHWALFVRNKIRAFPPIFNYFMLFFILHTIVTYAFLLPSEFTFGVTQEFQLQGGFVNFHQGNGMAVARFLLFALYAYAIASLLRTEKMLIAFALAYGTGFVTVMLLGGYRVVSGSVSALRLSAGFLNPNSFGASALMCIFLSLFILVRRHSGKLIKIFAVIFLGTGMFGLLSSASRNSILGLVVGLFVLLLYIPNVKMKIKIATSIVFIITLIGFFLPQHVWQILDVRASFIEKIGEEGIGNANVRFGIWEDYIREMPGYILTGVGFHRTTEATKLSYTTRSNWIPHNRYLHTIVEFGFLGFLLFTAGLWQLWKRIFHYHRWQMKITFNDSVILGFFSAWLIMLLFGSYSGSRDFWIFLGIIAAYGSRKVKSKQNNLLIMPKAPLPKTF